MKEKMVSRKNIFVISMVIMCTSKTVTGESCRPLLPEISKDTALVGADTVKLTQSDLQHCELLDKLVTLLEDLSVLTPRTTSCYTLGRITRDISPMQKFDHQRKITLTFQFIENFIQKSGGGYSFSDENGTSETPCQSSRTPELASMQSLSLYGYNASENKDVNRNESVVISTKKLEGNRNDDHSGGISNTQKLVIATCSAVIGTFFIIAGVMRIRNYIKRWRDDQASRERTYRLPLHSAGHESPEEFRRSSVNSKTGLQNSPTHIVHDALYHQVSNGLPVAQNPAPKTRDLNPVLVITAPSTTPNTPSDSSASIKYIDEENEDKVNTPSSLQKDDSDHVEVEPLIPKGETQPDDHANFDTFPTENTNDDDVNAKWTNENECGNLKSDTSVNGEIDPPDGKSLKHGVHSDEASHANEIDQPLPFSSNLSSGLTQSDESLGCNNPSYCYGNQAEYSFDSGYGQVAYHCPISDLDPDINDEQAIPVPSNNHSNHYVENDLCDENGNGDETSLIQISLRDGKTESESENKSTKRAPLVSVPSIVLEEYNGTCDNV